jgi:hypothetical protein
MAKTWAFTRNTNGWTINLDSEEFSYTNENVEMDTYVGKLIIYISKRIPFTVDTYNDTITVGGVAFTGTAKQLKDNLRDNIIQ